VCYGWFLFVEGNTGLVGGSVGMNEEMILSLDKMRAIIHIDTAASIITCESGCILEALENEVLKHGLMMPINLGSKGYHTYLITFVNENDFRSSK
jgi:FAD/FMN-containing dehydrogenase